MPNVEQRLTALEAASFTLTSEQQRLKADNDAYHADIDARLNSIADGLMGHRREVAERFDRVDAELSALRGGQSELKAGQSELQANYAELKAGQTELQANYAEL